MQLLKRPLRISDDGWPDHLKFARDVTTDEDIEEEANEAGNESNKS
jgi:hypothetical protein